MCKFKNRILGVVVAVVTLVSQAVLLTADANDDLAHYTDLLKEFNNTYQTDYILIPLTGDCSEEYYAELQNILSMSDEDFLEYVYNLHKSVVDQEKK